MRRKISAAVAVWAVLAGIAHADTSAADYKNLMMPFYTSGDMTTMRSDAEVKEIMKGMTSEQRKQMSTACSSPDADHKAFCDKMIRAMGDL